MESKLVLLIGQMFIDGKQTFLEAFKDCQCVFAENGLRGVATAAVMHPDIALCERNSSLISIGLVKYEILRANNRCKVLVIDNEA